MRYVDKTDCLDKMDASGQLLGLEDIQDPSNLGTVLRTAEALGIGRVILTRGCCDIYSPKVLRGQHGGGFRLPMALVETMPPAVNALEQKDLSLWPRCPTGKRSRLLRFFFLLRPLFWWATGKRLKAGNHPGLPAPGYHSDAGPGGVPERLRSRQPFDVRNDAGLREAAL